MSNRLEFYRKYPTLPTLINTPNFEKVLHDVGLILNTDGTLYDAVGHVHYKNLVALFKTPNTTHTHSA